MYLIHAYSCESSEHAQIKLHEIFQLLTNNTPVLQILNHTTFPESLKLKSHEFNTDMNIMLYGTCNGRVLETECIVNSHYYVYFQAHDVYNNIL